MQHTIEFIKASGAGNDFVIIDNMKGSLSIDQPQLAVALCSRPFGAGADGLLVLEPSTVADFQMRYYNADGSYGGMCGNGGRCIAMYAHRKGYGRAKLTFEALDHVYSAELKGSGIRLKMKTPHDFRPDFPLDAAGQTFRAYFIDTGSPHVVIFVDDPGIIEVAKIGRAVRYHSLFAPAGTNVNFVRLVAADTVEIRTYERGVEAETLACGTGSVASAAVASLVQAISSPVHVHVRSGETLLVHLAKEAGTITEASLEGSAHILFSGQAVYDDISRTISTTI